MEIQDWGEIEYEAAVDRQLALVEAVAAGNVQEAIVFCTHPPVVTLGRTTPASDLIGWQGSLVESSRGGRATYHGPSQMVVYPILDLRREDRPGLRSQNVRGYVCLLGKMLEDLVRELGVDAHLRQGTDIDEDGKPRQLTGVWIGERKVASIGVAVKKWVTYHGVAINVFKDATAFAGIKPCGFRPGTMVSLEELCGDLPTREDLKARIVGKMTAALEKIAVDCSR